MTGPRPAAAGRRVLRSRVVIRQASRRRQDSRHEGSIARPRGPAGPTVDARARRRRRARWRTSTRDGADARDATVRARRARSGARVDVVDAFFRTLLVDGYAERTRDADRRATRRAGASPRRARATAAAAARTCGDSRTCARSITPRRRRAGEDGKGRHAASSRDDLRPTTTTPRVPSAPTRARSDAPSDRGARG